MSEDSAWEGGVAGFGMAETYRKSTESREQLSSVSDKV